eukprot:Selendium_serpulae@DN2341_c0_g1_i1.p1
MSNQRQDLEEGGAPVGYHPDAEQPCLMEEVIQTLSRSNMGLDVNPNQSLELPPIRREKEVEVFRPEIQEQVVEVPQVQFLERIVEVPNPGQQVRIKRVPKIEVQERIISVPKPVPRERIVEVPQVQVVDMVVEVPQYIYQTKEVQKPKVIIQERIIPIPKKKVEERVVEVPEEQYCEILQDVAADESRDVPHVDQRPGWVPDKEGGSDLSPKSSKDRRRKSSQPSSYRGVAMPLYRHIPKPVEIPMAHYKPVPVEVIVNRNVPIPVELEVTQEFRCPRLEPRYKDMPVPIPVTRVIEKPVPADAMFNHHLLDAYMLQKQGGGGKPVTSAPIRPMDQQTLTQLGLGRNEIGLHRNMQSRAMYQQGSSDFGFNTQVSRGLL